MRLLNVILMMLAVVLFVGCGSSGDGGADSAAETATHGDDGHGDDGHSHAEEAAMANAVSMEVGCAGCIYHMDGITSCTPAVKVGETPMLLTGVPLDAHAMGLCEAPKTAMVVGKVEGDKFVVTSVELE